MAKEANVKSIVYDMTGGLLPAPADDGYNIVLPVYTPTGKVEKQKVTSQKDFIDKYMTGTTMRPDDHISAIFAYMILAQSPIYVVRGCPLNFLEGISSKGNAYLFDKSFNLLPGYFRFKIKSILDNLNYYYIKQGNYVYTTGDNSSIPSDEIESANKISISEVKSIDKLINGLLSAAAQNDASFKILKASDSTIITRNKISGYSSNIGKFNEIARSGIYKHCTTDSLVGSGNVIETNYISENGITYYFQGQNIESITTMVNPIPIISPDSKAEMVNKYFMLKVIAAAQASFTGQLTISIKDYTNSGKDVTFISSSDYANGITVKDGKLKIFGNFQLSKKSIGDYAIETKDKVSTKADLPTKDLIVGDKYIVTADASHDGKKYIYTAVSSSTFDEGVEFIEMDSEIAKIVATVNGKQMIYVLSDDKSADDSIVCFDEDTPAEFLSDLIDHIISHNQGLYASDSTNSLQIDGSLTYYSLASNGSLSSDYYVVTEDGDDDFTYYYYTSNDNNNKDYIRFGFLYLTVGNYLYWSGTMPDSFSVPSGKTAVKMSNKALNKEEFISALYLNLYITQNIGMYKEAFVNATELAIDYDSSVMEVASNVVKQNTTEQFAIVQKFPSKDAVFQFSYEKDSENEDIIDLHLNFKSGSVTEDWTMSFVPGVANGYGVDQWFTRVESENFKVVSLTNKGEYGELDDSFTSGYFGDSIGVPDYNVQFMKDAMQTIPNYEDGVFYDVVSDAGIVESSLGTVLENLASDLHSVYPASLDPNATNKKDLSDYVGAANFKLYNTRLLAAGDRVAVSGFSVEMPGSYKLILQLLAAFRNKANEFAPNFDKNHGRVGVANPTHTWLKEDREYLLDYKIETLKGGTDGSPYINDNVTAQSNKSYMSEEQNVRMTNTAVHILEDFVDAYKAEFNTKETRTAVQDGANDRLQSRLFRGKKYVPAMYRAVCDETNNTTKIIEDGYLVVDLYASFTPAIKWIRVNHYIVPLSQATAS